MALHDTVRAMAAVPPLCDLDADALRLIAFSADTRILRAGDILFRKGETSDCGYLVLSGSIAIALPPTLVGQATLIGETAMIAETTRPADAVAREPSSVLRISRALFHRVLSEYPDAAARVRHGIATRLLATQSEFDRLGEAVL